MGKRAEANPTRHRPLECTLGNHRLIRNFQSVQRELYGFQCTLTALLYAAENVGKDDRQQLVTISPADRTFRLNCLASGSRSATPSNLKRRTTYGLN